MAENPYINKYKRHLTRTEDRRGSVLNRRTAGRVLAGTAIGVGVLAGIHNVHSGGLYGAIDDVAKHTTSSIKALSDVNMKRRVKQQFDGLITGKRKSLRASISDTGQEFNRIRKNHLASMDELQGVSRLRKGSSVLNEGRLNFELNRDVAHNKIMKDVNNLMKGASKADDIVGFSELSHLKKMHQHKLANVSRQWNVDKSKFTQQIGNLDYSDPIKDSISNILKKHSGEFVGRNPNITKISKTFSDRMYEDIGKNLNKKSNFFKRTLDRVLGYKRATAEDVMSNASDINLNQAQLDDINKISQNVPLGIDEMSLDRNLYMRKGKLIDNRKTRMATDSALETFSQGLLGKVGYVGDSIQFKKHAAEMPLKVLRSGKNLPLMRGSDYVDDADKLRRTLIGVGDSLYDLHNPKDAVREGVEFTSGKFGAVKRLMTRMSGANIQDKANDAWWNNKVLEKLDVGQRQDPTLYQKIKSVGSKFDDDNWTPNKIKQAFGTYGQKTVNQENVLDYAYETKEYLSTYAEGFETNTLKKMLAKANLSDDFSFDTEEQVIEAFEFIKKNTAKSSNKLHFPGRSQVSSAFENNPEGLLSKTKVVQNTNFLGSNKIQTGSDLLQKEASKFLIEDIGVQESYGHLQGLLYSGEISGEEFSKAKSSIAEYIFQSVETHGMDKYGKAPGIQESFLKYFEMFRGDKSTHPSHKLLQDTLMEMTETTHSLASKGPVSEFENMFNADILAVNKVTKQDLSTPKGVFNFGKGLFTHGRDNMEEINKWDLYTYGFPVRVNEILGDVSLAPLSMSDDSLGSFVDASVNFGMKRVAPAIAGFHAMKYISDHAPGDYTLKQRYERGKAKTQLTTASIKDTLKITDLINYADSVTPGSENLVESMHAIPVAGWAAQWTGITSGKSQEELVDHFSSGYESVRDSRWWILGNSPWMGEGISHFEPSSYRKAMSEWEYTDTVWGSKENYWKHHWMPTPTNPLAPIRRFVTDRYWFEDMHKETRPYELSSPMFDPNNPFGHVANNTIGRILKPQRSYGAGLTDKQVEMKEDADGYSEHLIGQYKGGQISLQSFVPHYSMEQSGFMSEISQEYGYDVNPDTYTTSGRVGGQNQIGSPEMMTSLNEKIKGQSQWGSDYGLVGSSAGIAQGKAMSSQQLTEVNQGLKAFANSDRVTGKSVAMNDLASINSAIKEESKIIDTNQESIDNVGFTFDYRSPYENRERMGEPLDPRSLNYQIGHTGHLAKSLAGFRGFLTGMAAGGRSGEGMKVVDDASSASAMSSRFWEKNYGGRGGAVSEVGRRILRSPRNRIDRVNRLSNAMPDWMPGEEHYIDFKTGDPYTKVDAGEMRLPGGAYESLNKLHPDEFGMYGAVDRAAILKDVAPYSKEAKMWTKIAKSRDLTEEESELLSSARERSEASRDKHFLTPYQFKGEVDTEDGTINRFLSENRFTIHGSDEVYRLAGVKNLNFSGQDEVSMESLRVLQQSMTPGSQVQITAPRGDYEDGKPVVVQTDDMVVNRALLSAGVEEREEDGVIESYAKFGAASRGIGRAWETFSHAPIPIIHNKFISTRSPYEHYKEKSVYGKTYQDWNKPIDDFVKPAFRNSISRNPVMSGLGFGTFAGVMSMLFAGPQHFKSVSVLAGSVAAVASTARAASEIATGKAWIPKEVDRQRDIDEYFDKLKNVKYTRLYNKYTQIAKKEEGVDLDDKLRRVNREDRDISRKRRDIEDLEERLARREGDGDLVRWVNEQGRIEEDLDSSINYINHRIGELTQEINELQHNEQVVGLGPYAKRALQYLDKSESTLVALDEGSSHSQIYNALPKKEREYFRHFSDVKDPDKQEEILRLVPENQRRAYKLMWGRGDELKDEKKNLTSFFAQNYLPDRDWVGWGEGVDLEDSKKKVIDNEGLDLNDFGIWKDHSEQEMLTPAPNKKPGARFDTSTPWVNARLRNVLNKFSISDLQISTVPRNDGEVKINMDINYDLKDQIRDQLFKQLGG